MKTAEVAIEHVLAGVLTLCAFVLPLLSGLKIDRTFLQTEAFVGILGMAYLFGVVFDRVADTVLSPIEQWVRLCLANGFLKKRKLYFDGDPFPQDALEFSLRGEKNGRLEWMDTLRSRIRTSRELAVLGLPAAMGIAIYQSAVKNYDLILRSVSYHNPILQVNLTWWAYLAIAINLVLIFVSVYISSRRIFEIPQTRDLSEDDHLRQDQMNRVRNHMLIRSSPYVLVLINSAVTISIITAERLEHSEIPMIGVCGVVATLFALWAWSRITKTYMNFIYRKLSELLSEKG